jgi:hypothetical protein
LTDCSESQVLASCGLSKNCFSFQVVA